MSSNPLKFLFAAVSFSRALVWDLLSRRWIDTSRTSSQKSISAQCGTLSLCYLFGVKDVSEILTLLFLSHCKCPATGLLC